MSDAQFLALVAGSFGLIGALIGAAGPVIGQLLNSHAERRQERLRFAVQLGLADYQARIDAVKNNLLPPGQRVLPLVLYVDYHSRVVAELDAGPMTAEAFERLHQAHTEVKARFDEIPPYPIPMPGGADSDSASSA